MHRSWLIAFAVVWCACASLESNDTPFDGSGPEDAPDAALLLDGSSIDLGFAEDMGGMNLDLGVRFEDAEFLGDSAESFQDARSDGGTKTDTGLEPDLGFRLDSGSANGGLDSGSANGGLDSGIFDGGLDSGILDAGTSTFTGPPRYEMYEGRIAYVENTLVPPLALNLTGQTDAWTAIQLPFAFEIFGRSVPINSDLYVSSNGVIRVGTATATSQNTALVQVSPVNTDMMIAGFWDGLIIEDDVYALLAPDEVRVLWSNARIRGSSDAMLSFQLRLLRSSNSIEFRVFSNTRTSSGTASIGILDTNSGRSIEPACSPNCRLEDFYSGSIISFIPQAQAVYAPDFSVKTASMAMAQGYRNETLAIDFSVFNQGNIRGPSQVLTRALFSQDALWRIPTSAIAQSSLAISAPQAGLESRGVIRAPLALEPGVYNVALWLDDNWYSELNNSNNLSWVGLFEVLPYLGQIAVQGTLLPDGQVGQYYEHQFVQTGAPLPLWSEINPLPDGLQLSQTGLLFGTPVNRTPFAGTNIGIEVTQRGYAPARRSFNLRIY